MGVNPENVTAEDNPVVLLPEQTEDMASQVPPADDETEATARGVARATGIIAIGNISSRILGLLREIILSGLFGASAAVDAFKIAIIVPRGLYDLLIGGHVNSALIPVLSEHASHENRRDLWELFNALLGLVIIGVLSLVILLEILAPQIVRLVASDETAPETLRDATNLLRITAPALFFLSLFAVVSGLLYSLKRFTWPAFGASVFNATIVILTLGLADQIGITAAAVGWLTGSVVQVAIQFPDLRDARIRPRFRRILQHPGIRKIGLLYVPVMLSLGLDVLINRPFSYNLASGTGTGNISIMEWATTLIQFPHGLVATAISIAVLPTLSQQALAATAEGMRSFKDTLGLGLRLATVLILPATVGLFVLATPVIDLLFEHGAFTAADTVDTAIALRLYLIGLPFASLDLILIYAFYAQQNTLTPALIGLLSLIAYIATAVLLLPVIGFFSLMVADTVKHMLHSGVSGWLLWRKVGGLNGQRLISTAMRTIFTVALMGLITLGALVGLESVLAADNLFIELLLVVIPGLIGIAAFLAIGNLAQLHEIRWMFQLIRRRLG
jgi:putative peptidoglycan lipid II flippase